MLTKSGLAMQITELHQSFHFSPMSMYNYRAEKCTLDEYIPSFDFNEIQIIPRTDIFSL